MAAHKTYNSASQGEASGGTSQGKKSTRERYRYDFIIEHLKEDKIKIYYFG